MSRKKPNIVVPYDTKGQTAGLIQNIFDDMFVSHHTPNSISLDGVLFTLTLSNKKFVTEELKIDSSSDYVDIILIEFILHYDSFNKNGYKPRSHYTNYWTSN